MCLDPVTLTAVSAAVAIAGQGYSALSQGAQAAYESRVAGQNARLQEESRRDAVTRGNSEVRRYQREELGREMGRQNAALAANNIDPTFGSAADVRGDMAVAGREDVGTIRENATREARGFEINAMNYRSEALAARRRRTAAYVQGGFAMASTALGAATQMKRVSYGRGG